MAPCNLASGTCDQIGIGFQSRVLVSRCQCVSGTVNVLRLAWNKIDLWPAAFKFLACMSEFVARADRPSGTKDGCRYRMSQWGGDSHLRRPTEPAKSMDASLSAPRNRDLLPGASPELRRTVPTTGGRNNVTAREDRSSKGETAIGKGMPGPGLPDSGREAKAVGKKGA